ncbi:MAG: hypothetical protein IJY58_04655 [Alphaproteobacteria bacterium]|nr:hypothetical protein [Alphaproteobacteria bacterium]
MLKFIKNILLISYLKNKGIRRICFIIGLILAIIPLISWYNDLNNYFYNETYENISVFGNENKYNTKKQKDVYNKYPINFGAKKLDTFDEWQDFMFADYGEGFKARRYFLEQCYTLKHGDRKTLAEIFQNNEEYAKLQEFCPKFKQYMTKEIAISKTDFLYILGLFSVVFPFYLPFLLCCVIRWIYMGFKGK